MKSHHSHVVDLHLIQVALLLLRRPIVLFAQLPHRIAAHRQHLGGADGLAQRHERIVLGIDGHKAAVGGALQRHAAGLEDGLELLGGADGIRAARHQARFVHVQVLAVAGLEGDALLADRQRGEDLLRGGRLADGMRGAQREEAVVEGRNVGARRELERNGAGDIGELGGRPPAAVRVGVRIDGGRCGRGGGGSVAPAALLRGGG